MTVIHRSFLKHHLQNIDSKYQALQRAIEGNPISSGTAVQYGIDPDTDDSSEYASVSLDEIEDAVAYLKESVKQLHKRIHRDRKIPPK